MKTAPTEQPEGSEEQPKHDTSDTEGEKPLVIDIPEEEDEAMNPDEILANLGSKAPIITVISQPINILLTI